MLRIDALPSGYRLVAYIEYKVFFLILIVSWKASILSLLF